MKSSWKNELHDQSMSKASKLLLMMLSGCSFIPQHSLFLPSRRKISSSMERDYGQRADITECKEQGPEVHIYICSKTHSFFMLRTCRLQPSSIASCSLPLISKALTQRWLYAQHWSLHSLPSLLQLHECRNSCRVSGAELRFGE